MKNGLSQKEKLKSKIEIDALFKEGKSIFSFPFKLVYAKNNVENAANIQLLISVPKRNFKKAVDRNLLRRRIREAYRLNKQELQFDEKYKSMSLAIIYTHKEIRDFNELQKRLVLILRKLNSQLRSHS